MKKVIKASLVPERIHGPFTTRLLELLADGVINAENCLKELMQYLSVDEVERFAKDYVDIDEDEAYEIYSLDASTSVTAGRDFYFGKEEFEQYGSLISEKMSGKTISKRVDLGEKPGGLVYEANKLGIDMWDLLSALEGMCYNGTAVEIDDSTYRIK